MATEGYVKFIYHSKSVPPYYSKSGAFPELVDDETITIEMPSIDLSYKQYFAQFKKFLMALGFDEKNVMQGACHLAFNESNREEIMREVAEEYDLIMSEQLPEIIADRKKQDEEWIKKSDESWEQRYWALSRRFKQFSSFTDEELETIVNDALAKKTTPHCDMEALTTEQFTDKIRTGYSYWNEDTSNEEMWEQGMIEVSTNIPDPWASWNGLIPGTSDAVIEGCICPVLDNEEMPENKKWVNASCPIHGKKNKNS